MSATATRVGSSTSAVPQSDVAMSAATKSGAITAEGSAGKKQKKEEFVLKDLDLEPLHDGFKGAITVAKGELELMRDICSVEALVVKHHTAVRAFKMLLMIWVLGDSNP